MTCSGLTSKNLCSLKVVFIEIVRQYVTVGTSSRNFMFFLCPFAQINQFTALAAKRAMGKLVRIFNGALAGWAIDLSRH